MCEIKWDRMKGWWHCDRCNYTTGADDPMCVADPFKDAVTPPKLTDK